MSKQSSSVVIFGILVAWILYAIPLANIKAALKSSKMASETTPKYELLYHPGTPGRGEYIRLAFEAAQVPFLDVSNASKDGAKAVYANWAPDASYDSNGNPPPFAPPLLRVPGAGKNGRDLIISQTPNILLFLGPKLGLAGEDEVDKLFVNGLTLTALDLGNEAHDTHHPVATIKYYEEQKDEALKASTNFREFRIPKFVGYFERVLKGNKNGGGKYLVGKGPTYADTSLWQVLDGLYFAFPKELEARKKEFPATLNVFYEGLKEEGGVKAYLESGRRLNFSNGIFRHYPELDRQ